MVSVGKGWFVCTKNDEVIENKKVVEFLNYTKFAHLKNTTIRDNGVTGNAFRLKVKSVSWKPIWLQALDPRTMRIVVNAYWDVIKYIQSVDGKSQDFAPEEIKHLYSEKDPDNEIFGLSPMEGIITDVLADDEAALTNYYYFKNSAVPSQLIVLEEWMSEEEQSNAIEQLKKNFSGGKNKHKIGAVSGIKDIKKVQDTLADMQYEALRKFSREKICAAYGVPKTILWYTEGVNYTSADTQYRRFIENTIITREEKIEEWINEVLAEYKEFEGIKIKFDSDHIDDFSGRVDIAIKQMQYGLITPNEAREELWYEPYDFPEADQPLISRNLELLSDVWLSDIPNMNEET